MNPITNFWTEARLYEMAQWCINHDQINAAIEYYKLAFRWYG